MAGGGEPTRRCGWPVLPSWPPAPRPSCTSSARSWRVSPHRKAAAIRPRYGLAPARVVAPADGDPKALIAASSPPSQAVHAIDPEAKPTQGSDVQPGASQDPTALRTWTGAGAEAKAAPADPAAATAERNGSDPRSPRKRIAQPSISAPIVKYYPLGTELRVTGRRSGWIQVANPATSEQGWIYEIYLAPSAGPGERKKRCRNSSRLGHRARKRLKRRSTRRTRLTTSISRAVTAPVAKERRHFHARPAWS